jgi:hypothetical protein
MPITVVSWRAGKSCLWPLSSFQYFLGDGQSPVGGSRVVGEVGAKSHPLDTCVMQKMPTPKQQFQLPVMHIGPTCRLTLPSNSSSNTSGSTPDWTSCILLGLNNPEISDTSQLDTANYRWTHKIGAGFCLWNRSTRSPGFSTHGKDTWLSNLGKRRGFGIVGRAANSTSACDIIYGISSTHRSKNA